MVTENLAPFHKRVYDAMRNYASVPRCPLSLFDSPETEAVIFSDSAQQLLDNALSPLPGARVAPACRVSARARLPKLERDRDDDDSRGGSATWHLSLNRSMIAASR